MRAQREALVAAGAERAYTESVDAALVAIGTAVDEAVSYLRDDWQRRAGVPAHQALDRAVDAERDRCRAQGRVLRQFPEVYDEVARRLPGAFQTLRLLMGVATDAPLALPDPGGTRTAATRPGAALARMRR
ncbi:MAG: hypothetical protein H0X64_02420 [Gemmatimonadaceae bacterium]|nr:hypothetical protein [Gemmatimonadaceae bacterium]